MPPSRARASTLNHLHRMAAATAVLVACKSHGYAVVDPMPIPSKCAGDGQLKGTAVWKKGGDGGAGLQLVVTLSKVDPSSPGNLTVIVDGTVISAVTDATGVVTVVVQPTATQTYQSISYSFSCEAGVDTRGASIFWTNPPVEGRTETVSI